MQHDFTLFVPNLARLDAFLNARILNANAAGNVGRRSPVRLVALAEATEGRRSSAKEARR